jgi:hypothetical protein
VSELRWFDIDDLPADIPFASDRRALDMLRAMLRGRRLPGC